MAVMDDQGNFWGLVTVSDLDRAIEQNLPDETLVTVFGKRAANLQIAFPDESMGAALTRMDIRGVGRLPVVLRTNRDHLEGLIRRADIIRAYNLALTKRAEIQQD
jgi:CIC family chloride channel protein